METFALELPTTALLIIIGCLLALSAFFSASEIALFSFRKTRLALLVRQKNKKALLVNRILQKPERLISTILVGNNIVNIAATTLATALAISLFGQEGILFAMIIMTFVLIQMCEITPKVFASQLWEKTAFVVVRPLQVFGWVFYPAVVFSGYFTRFLFGLLGRKIEYAPPRITREELKHTVNLAAESGHLKKQETEMLENVFKFHDRLIKEIMLPKEKIDALDFNGTREEQLKFITEKHHTRIPVYQNNTDAADNIKGILHTKEYLNTLCYQNLIVLEDLLHLPYFVDEDKKISEVLQELRGQHLHLAIVTDKNKQVRGLVTIEDIIEEIIGEAS